MACLLALGGLMRRSCCVAMVVALWFACLSAAQAQQRVALVIGNGAYTSEAALPNAVRDAELVAEGFKNLGFQVTLHRNLDYSGLKQALRTFETEARGAEVAAIYFSGHGIAVDGRNWMLPVDAKLASARHVEDEAVAHTRFISTVGDAKGLQLVILDACRNNPFAPRLAQQEKAQGGRTRNVATRGLERIPENELPPNQLVAFSAREGQVAHDGPPGANGPYAMALRSRMEKAGTEIGLLFRQVRDDVMSATNNKQEPSWDSSRLGGKELYLALSKSEKPDPAPAALPAPADECDRLAQPPRWEMGRFPSFAEGVTFERLDGAAAIAACERAVNRYPDEVRFVYLLGRASGRVGRNAEMVRHFQIASNRGFAPAQHRLGISYKHRDGVKQDDQEAVRLVYLAVRQGYAGAQSDLGIWLLFGELVPKDVQKGIGLIRLAAEQGHGDAAITLGDMYKHGRHVKQNDTEAARLFRLGADQGEPTNQVLLGEMYEAGRGVLQSVNEAVRLYRLAARQGSLAGQDALRRLKQDW